MHAMLVVVGLGSGAEVGKAAVELAYGDCVAIVVVAEFAAN